MRYDILNRLGVDHDCDGQTERRTEPLLAIARSNDSHQNLLGVLTCESVDSRLLSPTFPLATFTKRQKLTNHFNLGLGGPIFEKFYDELRKS